MDKLVIPIVIAHRETRLFRRYSVSIPLSSAACQCYAKERLRTTNQCAKWYPILNRKATDDKQKYHRIVSEPFVPRQSHLRVVKAAALGLLDGHAKAHQQSQQTARLTQQVGHIIYCPLVMAISK